MKPREWTISKTTIKHPTESGVKFVDCTGIVSSGPDTCDEHSFLRGYGCTEVVEKSAYTDIMKHAEALAEALSKFDRILNYIGDEDAMFLYEEEYKQGLHALKNWQTFKESTNSK